MAAANNAVENTSENAQSEIPPPSFPHFESFDRMMKFPVVEAAISQSAGVYGRVKGANSIFNWAFSTAEATVHRALTSATPIVQKFDRPIHAVDQTIVRGIEKLEASVPLVKEQPQQIYENAKTAVAQVVQPTINKVCAVRHNAQRKAVSLKELSWNKANEVLATQYGQMAVTGVDTTSALAERLIDYYFPASAEDNEDENAPISQEDDPALHTVQTVGRLSNKAARRVYFNVSTQLKNLKTQDVREYVASLIAVLQLTQYLHHINRQIQPPVATTSQPTNEQSAAVAPAKN